MQKILKVILLTEEVRLGQENARKYGQEILELLKALWAPQKVTVMHCPGHQKGKTPVALGNQRADQEACEVPLHSTRPACDSNCHTPLNPTDRMCSILL
jgi:hypothetical protein